MKNHQGKIIKVTIFQRIYQAKNEKDKNKFKKIDFILIEGPSLDKN